MFGIKSIIVNAGQLMSARLLTQTVRVVYVIVLARYLGPEVYGLFAYAQSWYMAFLPVTMFGLGAIISREVGRHRERGAGTVRQVAFIRVLASIFGAAACALIGWFVDLDPAARQLILVFALALVGRTLATTAEEIFSAYERSRYILRQEAVFRPLEVVAGLAVLVLGGGAVDVALIHSGVWWLQAASGLYLVHRNLVTFRSEATMRGFKLLLGQAVKVGFAGILSAWLLHGPLVLFRHVAESPASLGQLALTIQALAILCTVPWAISRAALPVLSRAAARQDGKDLYFADVMTRIGFIMGAAAGISGLALGPWLVLAIFGESYLPAGHLLGIAFWLLVPLTAATSASQVLIAHGRFAWLSVSAGIGALTLTASLPPLAGALGPQGALLATGLGLSAWAVCILWQLVESGGILLGRTVLRPGLVAAGSAGVYFAAALAGAGAWPALLIGLLVLIFATLRFVFPPAERNAIRDWLRGTET